MIYDTCVLTDYLVKTTVYVVYSTQKVKEINFKTNFQSHRLQEDKFTRKINNATT